MAVAGPVGAALGWRPVSYALPIEFRIYIVFVVYIYMYIYFFLRKQGDYIQQKN